MVEEGSTDPRGEALLQELLWVHGIIRGNLAAIRQIVNEIVVCAPAEEVRAQIDELAATSIVWRLRVDCMRYCHLVHSHHHLEDVAFFPFLCQANPTLQSVVDKLQSDHVVVSDYLDAVEAAAARIVKYESARSDLAAALTDLSEHLITH